MPDDELTRKDAEMGRLTTSELLSTTDARAWAREFHAVWTELKIMDEGWLIGWFANAIETGRAAGQRSLESVREEAPVIPVAAWVYAYTSLGCDLESAEKMVKAEIAKWFDEANYRINHPTLKPICDLVASRIPQSPARVAEDGAFVTTAVPDPYGRTMCAGMVGYAAQAESPAKEQPGGQNAQENECRPSSESGASNHEAGAATESSGYLSQGSVVQPVPPDGIGSLAPDVAAMVKRLRDRARELVGSTLITAQYDARMMFEAAALIEKPGQGWIQITYAEAALLTGSKFAIRGTLDGRWWRFDLPELPPPPERP